MAKKTRKLFKKGTSNNWKCKIQYRDNDGKLDGKQFSLGTSNKAIAWQRYEEINAKLDDLKQGLRFVWSWERKSKNTQIKVQTIDDAFNQYIKYQQTCGFKSETIYGTQNAYDRFVNSKCVAPKMAVRTLSQIDFQTYKEYWQGTHTPNTINQSINKMKAFLNYCKDRKWISDYKTMTSTLEAKPVSYFTDEEFKLVMDALETDEQKRAILFYHQTGCRKSEPFIASRVGNTLIIPPMKKNKMERRIQLTDFLCQVHNEMMTRFNKRSKIVKTDKANWDWWYLALKKACKKVGIAKKTLHDLRDTYIVRLWATTGDIHLVSQIIGHSDIKQTVEYARFTPNELLVHFPSLKKYLEPRLKVAESLMVGSVLVGREYESLKFIEGERTK